MKKIFLTSSGKFVAKDVAERIGKKGLKLLFVITASEPKKDNDLSWQDKDRNALVEAGFDVEDYTFTGKTKVDIENKLDQIDVLYVSGGNVFYLLQQIQQTGCADVIRNFVNKGKIYIGTSAGSIVAGPDIYPTYNLDRVEKAPKLKGYVGLGLVDVVVLPHWGSEHFKDRYLNQRLEHTYNMDNKIILLTDKQYLLVENDFYKIVEVD